MSKNMWRYAWMGGLFLFMSCGAVGATDLLQVYQQALKSDPTYRQALTSWQSSQMNVPIAASLYRPQVQLTGAYAYNKVGSDEGHWGYQYGLNVAQAMFNMQIWYALQSAHVAVKAATAGFFASKQSLIARTAQAYLTVLQASDVLRYVKSNELAVKRSLITTQEQYRVGLIAITNVYEALSQYNLIDAARLLAQNELRDALEALKAITGQQYTQVEGIKKQVPLIVPKPDNIQAWVKLAVKQNYSLAAAHYTALAKKKRIHVVEASRYPTVSAFGTYGYPAMVYSDALIPVERSLALGVSVSFPLLQGGSPSATLQQPRYAQQTRFQYLNAVAKQEFAYRATIQSVRQTFLGVHSGVSQVKADKASVLSAQKSLSATQASFIVGTRTYLNVLAATSTLYKVQQQYASDQYVYLQNLIGLKQAAGTLSEQDLKEINSWLTRPVMLFQLMSSQGLHSSVSPIRLPAVKRTSVSSRSKPLKSSVGQTSPVKSSSIKRSSVPHRKASSAAILKAYAVQLFAATDRHQALDFIRKQGKDLSLRVEKKGRWYKVVYGSFATINQARQALARLPQRLLRYKPWVYKY